MQNSGRARRDQAADRLAEVKIQAPQAARGKSRVGAKGGGGGHTNGNNVQEVAPAAEVEGSSLNLLAAGGQADGDGSRVRGRQADDTDTGEGVEGGRRAKVDEAEEDLDDGAQHHSVERDIEVAVDLHPPLGAGDGAVAGKGPGAAGRGRGAADAAEEGEDHERDQQANGAAGRANGLLDDGRDGLAGRQGDEHLDVGEDEDERDEEEEAGEGVDGDGRDHGLGNLDRGLLHLLAHAAITVVSFICSLQPGRQSRGCSRDNHASRRGGIAGVQKTDAERPAIGPARVGLEVAEDVLGVVAAVLGEDEDRDHDGDDTGKGPEDGSGLGGARLALTL